MDLEARTLQPNTKAMVLAKLREYKNDLNNLKSEVKRLSSTDSQAARDALLESGMADALMVSAISFFCLSLWWRAEANLLDVSWVDSEEKLGNYQMWLHIWILRVISFGCVRLHDDQASADQRGRLLMSTERLNQSSDRVRQSRMTMQETEAIGVSILEDLHQQRQSLLHAHNTVSVAISLIKQH